MTHLNERGDARMVDISEKDRSLRVAVAEGELRMNATVRKVLFSGRTPKGDALAAARIAGIQAAKRTSELIPLCHPIATTSVEIEIKEMKRPSSARVKATVKVNEGTGAEMEALTGVSVALLTIYDMLKSMQKDLRMTDVRLRKKKGGKSGNLKLP